MATIAVDKAGLLDDFYSWGVTEAYSKRFIDKNKFIDGKVELSGFAFNDSVSLTDSSQWIAANAAFWCRFYREAPTCFGQAQALGAIQSLYYTASMLGFSSLVIMILEWWRITFPLHDMESLNMQFAHARNLNAVH